MASITLAAVTLAIVLLSRKDCCIHESQVFSIQGVKKKTNSIMYHKPYEFRNTRYWKV